MESRTRAERDFYRDTGGPGTPFWIPAPNYYLAVAFAAIVVFAVVLAALYEEYDDAPWIIAGISSAIFVAALFFLREVVFRRYRRRELAARRLSHQLRGVKERRASAGGRISIQQNEQMLREIRSKSDAAKVLGKVAEAHREVFDLCERYLAMAASEISRARPGSPRIPALRKGSKLAATRHRLHMLKWAEIKARSFGKDAARDGLPDTVEAAQSALDAVERALAVYPDEPDLAGSRDILWVFLASARIKNSIEKAEQAVKSGSMQLAIGHYTEALSELENCEVEFSEREAISQRILSEIGRISKAAEL
ncbi:MAG: hypothetical protein AB7F88_14330 [Pyrinomonadaceae bacterium]